MRYNQQRRKIFPISLIMENKTCLVVGGGRAALRKIDNLLASEVSLTLVSPQIVPALREYVIEGRIDWVEREFRESDLDGADLVYCATGESDLNRSLMALCRRRRILCCAVDKNWPEGDFMTPATFRKEELAISISTGGHSCRRSRLVKQSLSRHVDMIDSADLLLMGTSHNQLDLAKREPFHLAGEKLDHTGRMIRHVWGVHEFMILNTCNRVEIMAIVADDENVEALLKRVLGFDRLAEGEFYVHRGWDAFVHSATLMAGLYSQTPGENHIVAQSKEAFQVAGASQWSGIVLEDWFSRALGISKKIRRETGPLLKNMEIEDVAVEYLARTLEGSGGIVKAMVIGTGIIGKGVLEKFLERKIPVLWCYHRFIPELTDAQKEWVELCPLEEMNRRIPECNGFITATGSPDYLIDRSQGECFSREGLNALVDLSLPRNISPDLAADHIKV
ncbi:MAG: NAD(P)-dependent oxidoreductase, partial [Spirochaetales bacterium]|nr:NAD(P)-dependent oxidoreductase [Spirochaetales bacterium]